VIFLDDLETNKVVDFEAALIAYMNAIQTTLMDKISKNGDYNDDKRQGLMQTVQMPLIHGIVQGLDECHHLIF
jgi:F0F1-type ATP synthase alpha subunit